jgi:hypothetical protein
MGGAAMSALRELIEAVERGDATPAHFNTVWGYHQGRYVAGPGQWAHEAYGNDLNAARALHEAVLPNADGWWWSVEHEDPEPPGFRAWVWNNRQPLHKIRVNALGHDPARAWLLAILKAMEVQQ